MQEKLFYEKHQKGHWVFKKLLTVLECPLRHRFNNPEQLVGASGIKPGQTVLEIGCGSVFFTVSSSQMVGEQGLVFAIDIHPAAVEETAKKINDLKLTKIKVRKADVHETCFAERTVL